MNLDQMKFLCSLDKKEIFTFLYDFLKKHNYDNIILDNKFLIAEGALPICLLAHVDTVFKYPPNTDDFIYDDQKKIFWSPYGSGFDDRAGIYAILNLIIKGYKPSIIFTDEEEAGCIGASELVNKFDCCPFECKALIQLDRVNEKDCVFYRCCNQGFIKYIEKYGFKTEMGTFTDISVLAPAWGIVAVNLSIGYIDEHTTSERLNCEWCDSTIEKVSKILDEIERMPVFKYEEKEIHIIGHNNYCPLCGKSNVNTILMESDQGYYYICEDCYDLYFC